MAPPRLQPMETLLVGVFFVPKFHCPVQNNSNFPSCVVHKIVCTGIFAQILVCIKLWFPGVLAFDLAFKLGIPLPGIKQNSSPPNSQPIRLKLCRMIQPLIQFAPTLTCPPLPRKIPDPPEFHSCYLQGTLSGLRCPGAIRDCSVVQAKMQP